ncbi:MAG: FtsX-like permease family protein [Candidatus Tectomicrobia bacterium]|uniref:FtsX-like permease family protein n=1 Tax=Tectimicrobiota bacterium TaxID=2528274 RepID=A0A932M1A9_UNCTE|nr:FtsX-like permease family protein [Candidatus Tectomicrobia bacterium]
MLFRLLRKSLRGRKGRIALTTLAVAVAASAVSVLLNVTLDIGEKVGRELRAYGANIIVSPKQDALEVEIGGLRYAAAAKAAYLNESDLPKLKTIFWAHNIVAFAPFLSGTVEIGNRPVLLVGTWFDREIPLPGGIRKFRFGTGNVREVKSEETRFRTGIKAVAPWWQLQGRWIANPTGEALVGSALARRLQVNPGDLLPMKVGGLQQSMRIAGIVRTGGAEEDQVIVELAAAQTLLGLPGKVDRVQVSALVKPDDALALRGKRNPQGLPPEEFERWYCSPYIDPILFQIEEALPAARAKALRQVAEAEGAFVRRMNLTMLLVTGLAMVMTGFGVAATMTTTVLERRSEIGLMKALGADRSQIARQFILEASLCGIAGGIIGAAAGAWLSRLIGTQVFQVPINPTLITLPFTLALAMAVALLGAAAPAAQAARLDPVHTLRETL